MSIVIRKAKLEDLKQILDIDRSRYGKISEKVTADQKMMEKRINISHDWFFVAEDNGDILGYLSLQPTGKSIEQFTSWETSTDDGTLQKTYEPNGKYVYGVALTTSPKAKNLDVSHMLFMAAGEKIISEKKKLVYFSGRMPFFYKFKNKYSPEEYYNKRIIKNGKEVALDPQIKMYESFGLKRVRLVEKGFVGDWESGEYGVIFKADNLFYSLPFPKIFGRLFRAVSKNKKLLEVLLKYF